MPSLTSTSSLRLQNDGLSGSGTLNTSLSRPDSVTSIPDSNLLITSRPPSVSSERELHYASLDLPPSAGQTIHNQRMEIDEAIATTTTAANTATAAAGATTRIKHNPSLFVAVPNSSSATSLNRCESVSSSASASPSPNLGLTLAQQQQHPLHPQQQPQQPDPAFTYAQIDFVKSENLKAAQQSKVNH